MPRESKSQKSPFGSELYSAHLDFMKSLMDIGSSISQASVEYGQSVSETLSANMNHFISRKKSYDQESFFNPLFESGMKYGAKMMDVGIQSHHQALQSAQDYSAAFGDRMRESMNTMEPVFSHTRRCWEQSCDILQKGVESFPAVRASCYTNR